MLYGILIAIMITGIWMKVSVTPVNQKINPTHTPSYYVIMIHIMGTLGIFMTMAGLFCLIGLILFGR